MTFIYIAIAAVIAVLLIFIIIIAVNTAANNAKARRLTNAPDNSNGAKAEYYAKRLQKMIQCKTVSVKASYDDTEFAKLRNVVKGLFPLIHERAEMLTFSDDCWIYRIKGKNGDRNIMLMSHHDVVPADGEWKYGSFSGEIAEGKIWGRGTIDTKTPLFAELSALEELLEEGYDPECNVYIGSSHNEELGGDGIPKALEYFRENGIKFEIIVDEGGGVIDPPVGGMKSDKCAMVAVHEKGIYYLKCTIAAQSGHAGLTSALRSTPTERMAAFISEISSKNIFIRRLNPQIRAMFKHLAPYCSFPMNVLFSNLWCFGGILKAVMPKLNPQAGGLIGTVCSFRDIQCDDEKHTCTADAVLRPVDGNDLAKDIEAFKSVAQKHGVEVVIEEKSEYHAPADMSQSGFFYIMKCIAEIFPQYPAAPFILPAGTDARTLTELCPCVMRFAPIRMSNEQLASVHSENENIDLSAVPVCVEFYKHFLRGYK